MGQISLVLLVLGTVSAYYCVRAVRESLPVIVLRQPVSLSPGHILVNALPTTQIAFYQAGIRLTRPDLIPAGCASARLAAKWTHSDDRNRIIAGNRRWEWGSGTVVEFYYTPKARLDIEIAPGAECLNASKPDLFIFKQGSFNAGDEFWIWVAFLPLGVGIVLAVRTITSPLALSRRLPRMLPELALANHTRYRRQSTAPLISSLPHFPLVWAFFISGIMFFFMTLRTPNYSGFELSIKGIGPAWLAQTNPWEETLAVNVDENRTFLINRNPVDRSHFRAELKLELNRRLSKVVYFEADRDCLFEDATEAMDGIRATGGTVEWITPSVRTEIESSRLKR